jgi:DNA-binding NtrC family response regulator
VEDILLLARHFFARYARETRKSVEGFTPEAEMLLQNHPFPGNARELRNLVEQAVIFCRDRLIGPDDLKFQAVIEALQPEKSVVATAVASDRVFFGEKRIAGCGGFFRFEPGGAGEGNDSGGTEAL